MIITILICGRTPVSLLVNLIMRTDIDKEYKVVVEFVGHSNITCYRKCSKVRFTTNQFMVLQNIVMGIDDKKP